MTITRVKCWRSLKEECISEAAAKEKAREKLAVNGSGDGVGAG